MFFKNLCVLVLWMKVASALEGLNIGGGGGGVTLTCKFGMLINCVYKIPV